MFYFMRFKNFHLRFLKLSLVVLLIEIVKSVHAKDGEGIAILQYTCIYNELE